MMPEKFLLDVAHAFEGALKIPESQAGWATPHILGGLRVLLLGAIFFAGGLMVGSLTGKRKPGTDRQVSSTTAG